MALNPELAGDDPDYHIPTIDFAAPLHDHEPVEHLPHDGIIALDSIAGLRQQREAMSDLIIEKPYLSEDDMVLLLMQQGLYTPLVYQAMEEAKHTHAEQVRDDGSPYLTQHVYPVVADVIRSRGRSHVPVAALIAGYLHDVVEDDGIRFSIQRCGEEYG